MWTGSGETSLVSQAPAKRFMRWLLRYLTSKQLINWIIINVFSCPDSTSACHFVLFIFVWIILFFPLYKSSKWHFCDIPWNDFSHQPFGRVLDGELLGHQVVGVQRINGELNEDRTRGSRLSNRQGLPECRHNFPDGPDGGTELTKWLEERHLVDVLECSSALCHKRVKYSPSEHAKRSSTGDQHHPLLRD